MLGLRLIVKKGLDAYDSSTYGLKPLEFSEAKDAYDADGDKASSDDGCVHNVKLTFGNDVQVLIKRCSLEVLLRLIHKMKEVC